MLEREIAASIYIYIYICKKIGVKNSFTNTENNNGSVVRYPTDIKSGRTWSQLEASYVSSHTKSCDTKNSLSADDNIHLCIY